MPSEEKHKINVWIPESLWKQIESLGHDSPTKATIAAFEALAIKEAKGSSQGALGSRVEEKLPELEKQIRDLENSTREKNTEIGRLKKIIQESPDPLELSRLQVKAEELEKQLDDKEKELEFLKGQITIKDQQIDKQAFSLQSVIQENSRLNLKLLPESQETKNTQEQKFTRWQYLKGFMFGTQ